LLATSEVTATVLYEKAAIRLPIWAATVAPSARIDESPAGPLPSTAVSDTQWDDAVAVIPSTVPALRESVPIFAPSTVTLVAAPVAGPFVDTTLLAAGPANEKAATTELVCKPSEATKARDAPAPSTDLARTALFDIHSEASVQLPPIREDRLSPPPS
jgi:hypothetical protein